MQCIFSVTKVLQCNSSKFELPKYTMMWSLISEWQAKNLSIFLANYVIFKLATSVFQRCFDWMDTFVLTVSAKNGSTKSKRKGGRRRWYMAKIGSITYSSKTFMIKTDHQSIRLNSMQYFQTYFDLNKYIWIQDNFSYSIKEEYIGWNRMRRGGRRRKLEKSLLFGKFWTFYLSSLWIPKGV